jgi:enoyl-CoA hydratase
MTTPLPTTSDELHRSRVGAVAVLMLNRPQSANALSPSLVTALGGALDAAAADDEVGAIVLTGAGERVFCAGMDLKAFAETDRDLEFSDDAIDLARRFGGAITPDYPLPIVAAVNGAAVAGGFELLMGCDIVVAAPHAVFGVAEVKRGLIPGGGGTTLAARIPLALALELVLTGDSIDAARACEVGLVNRVAPADDVLDTAIGIATRIAENGPLAVRTAKRLVRRGAQSGTEAAWPDRADLEQIFNSEDAKEGALAFVERRPARFTGR